jgi:hypothetical protein
MRSCKIFEETIRRGRSRFIKASFVCVYIYIYIYIYIDLHIILVVVSSLKFADPVVDPCYSLVKYSDGRDKERGQTKLHRLILTKFWTPSVCLTLSLSHTLTHTHTHTHTQSLSKQ